MRVGGEMSVRCAVAGHRWRPPAAAPPCRPAAHSPCHPSIPSLPQVLLYKHDKTGAQLMSVVTADENKTFGVTFRTPVANSRGVPHILEHSVLCGSRKYPIKARAGPGLVCGGNGWWVVVVGGGAPEWRRQRPRPPRPATRPLPAATGAVCGADEGQPQHLPQRLHLPRPHLLPGAAAGQQMWLPGCLAAWFAPSATLVRAHPTHDRPPCPLLRHRWRPPTCRTFTTWWMCTWMRCCTPSEEQQGGLPRGLCVLPAMIIRIVAGAGWPCNPMLHCGPPTPTPTPVAAQVCGGPSHLCAGGLALRVGRRRGGAVGGGQWGAGRGAAPRSLCAHHRPPHMPTTTARPALACHRAP